MLEEVGESTMLEFYGYKTDVNNCTFQIGFSSTDTETASFTFGEEITSYNDFQYHRYSTPVPAGTKYICWKQVSGGIVLDDILVYHELWETVDVAGSGAHVATTIDGTHVSATLEGLTPGTDYEVQMKSDCDEAEWSETLAITTPDFEADGDIYTIYTADGWNAFCDALQYNGVYNRFIGKTVRLGADITVGRMAGGSGHEFMGTFDGQGHTLTVNYTTTAQFTAPFSYINGATIMNLTTGGTINTSAKFAGGMVGATLGVGTIEITNCVSDVTINSSVNGDGTHGGFLAVASYGAVNFTGCMFSGEMLGESTTLWAGFVGWTESNHNATVTFTDCLFNPTNLATNSGRTFSRARNMSSVTITNCYYTVPLGTAQGYPAVSDPNILPYGDPTGTYPVSDLTAYINGLMYGDVFYYNPESIVAQTVSLTAGKNWFSTNIEITLDALKAALVATGNASITIASQSEGNTTYANGRWRGSLTALDVKQMYKITVVTSCEIVLEGMPINPAEHPVTIHNGANWIGFPLGTSMALTDAFAGFAVNGDMVVSQSNGSATYTGGRWRGQLTTVEPGQGYIYKSSVQENRTFTFPMSTK